MYLFHCDIKERDIQRHRHGDLIRSDLIAVDPWRLCVCQTDWETPEWEGRELKKGGLPSLLSPPPQLSPLKLSFCGCLWSGAVAHVRKSTVTGSSAVKYSKKSKSHVCVLHSILWSVTLPQVTLSPLCRKTSEIYWTDVDLKVKFKRNLISLCPAAEKHNTTLQHSRMTVV